MYTQRISYWFTETQKGRWWFDFDAAAAFSSRESMGSEEEYVLLEYEIDKGSGELLVRIPLTLLLS